MIQSVARYIWSIDLDLDLKLANSEFCLDDGCNVAVTLTAFFVLLENLFFRIEQLLILKEGNVVF